MTDFEALRSELSDLLLGDDNMAPITWTQAQVDGGVSPVDFFNEVFTPAMTAVGSKFGRMEIFLPELMDAADRAQKISDDVIQPLLDSGDSGVSTVKGKIVICSVQGDLHDIGKNMVALMLSVNGYEVVDLGVNVPVATVLERVKDEKADIAALSSLMTTSMPYMKEVVERRDGFDLTDDFAVIVGGAPITADYSAEIGANAFGDDAVDAVAQCNKLMEARSA
jgi:methanogenic corrinoid protein MtbC1